ncbi:MAG: ADP-ribosylglycohydrolase family protein [Vicinamibacterales bacterium]
MLRERLFCALKGLATGDAVGKQTEGLSREAVLERYPGGIHGFEGRPGELIPRYVGNPRREWRIGETTDDTECTVAVARAILRDPGISHITIGEELLTCEKSVHPGVKSYWEFHQAGDPGRVAQRHDGCGAAIRVAPVGFIYRPAELDRLVAAAYQVSIPTHGGPLAIAAAAATAAAVSAAIEGWSPAEVASCAADAARRAEHLWPPPEARSMSAAIARIRESLADRSELRASDVAAAHFPDGPLTIVPLAIALATVTGSAEQSTLLAANIGGDSDSVASIAGAIAGAISPDTVNDDWYRVVEDVNQHGLVRLADAFGQLRR